MMRRKRLSTFVGKGFSTAKRRATEKYSVHSRSLKVIKYLDTLFGIGNAYVAPGTYVPDNAGGANGPLPLHSVGGTQALNIVLEGAGLVNRVGRKISMKSLRLRLSIVQVPTPVPITIPITARVVVYYDRQVDNAYGNFNVFFGSMTVGNTFNASTSNAPWGMPRPDFSDRMVVLMDKTFMLPTTQATTASTVSWGTPMIIDEYQVE